MKSKPDKLCGKGAGLTWSRKTVAVKSSEAPFARNVTRVRWTLFRRDLRNKIHQFTVELDAEARPAEAAGWLKHAKRRLRDQVDEIDLKDLGVAA